MLAVFNIPGFSVLAIPFAGLICLFILIVAVGYAKWGTEDETKKYVLLSLEKVLMVVTFLFIVLSVVVYLKVFDAI